VRHRLEAYTPKEKRQFGYFAMPVLGGTRLVGLVDPGREGDVFVAKQVTVLDVESKSTALTKTKQKAKALEHVARATLQAASWVGCTSVSLGRVEPEAARRELVGLLNRRR
jgi:hypothetical protein